MKVIVVENEQRIAEKLHKALSGIDASIHTVTTTPDDFYQTEWLLERGNSDIILVRKDAIEEKTIRQWSVVKIMAVIMVQDMDTLIAFHAYRLTASNHFSHPILVQPKQANDVTIVVPQTASYNGAVPFTTAKDPGPEHRTRFLVKQGQKLISVETTSIAYFFSEGRFIFFKTLDNQKYLVEYTLEDLELMLNPSDFFRVNRSYIIAFKSVDQIHPYFGSRLKLFLNPGIEKDVIVSREKVNDFKSWLGE